MLGKIKDITLEVIGETGLSIGDKITLSVNNGHDQCEFWVREMSGRYESLTIGERDELWTIFAVSQDGRSRP